jgi:two-component system NarL family sensor kinase
VFLAQETERKHLARELHDGVGQILSGVKFRLEALPGELALRSAGGAKIRKVGALLDHAISEIRRVSQNLMPSELEDLGLEPALRALCREFQGRARVAMVLRAGRIPEDIEPELAVAVFRIAQEALNNVAKHSKASKVTVALAHAGPEILLSVSDNGVGFRRDLRPGARHGIGLGSMRERARAVGGSIRLRSVRGEGTTLFVRAPLSMSGKESR